MPLTRHAILSAGTPGPTASGQLGEAIDRVVYHFVAFAEQTSAIDLRRGQTGNQAPLTSPNARVSHAESNRVRPHLSARWLPRTGPRGSFGRERIRQPPNSFPDDSLVLVWYPPIAADVFRDRPAVLCASLRGRSLINAPMYFFAEICGSHLRKHPAMSAIRSSRWPPGRRSLYPGGNSRPMVIYRHTSRSPGGCLMLRAGALHTDHDLGLP